MESGFTFYTENAGLLSLRDPASARAAIETVTEVHASLLNARIAPDLEVGYGYCRITYSTHAIGGLSQNDFICAAKIDRISL